MFKKLSVLVVLTLVLTLGATAASALDYSFVFPSQMPFPSMIPQPTMSPFPSFSPTSTPNIDEQVRQIFRRRQNFYSIMSGVKEVPGPGDPDGIGLAKLKITDSQVCVDLKVYNIAPATAAHIHRGELGVAGPIVVMLPTPNSSGVASGCVNVSNSLINEIKDNPSGFYVNVHNADYPGGAMRDQVI